MYAMTKIVPACMDPNFIETNLVLYMAADVNLRRLLGYISYRLQRRRSQISRDRVEEYRNMPTAFDHRPQPDFM
jgi:hypothetical protein